MKKEILIGVLLLLLLPNALGLFPDFYWIYQYLIPSQVVQAEKEEFKVTIDMLSGNPTTKQISEAFDSLKIIEKIKVGDNQELK